MKYSCNSSNVRGQGVGCLGRRKGRQPDGHIINNFLWPGYPKMYTTHLDNLLTKVCISAAEFAVWYLDDCNLASHLLNGYCLLQCVLQCLESVSCWTSLLFCCSRFLLLLGFLIRPM